jgi:hypothetical protein
MKLEFPGQILEKSSNIKFYENLASGSRYVNADRETDIKQPIFVFRNFAFALEDWPLIPTFFLSPSLPVQY